MAEILLKSGREKSIKRRHPWVFSGAVQKVFGNPQIGETVKVISESGEELGWGAFSPHSSIRVRMWNFDIQELVDELFIFDKMRIAINQRNKLSLINKSNNSCRLIIGESDGLPGLIVDRYANMLVVQILSAGPEKWKESIVKGLIEITNISSIYERSDVDVRELEGMPIRKGWLAGDSSGEKINLVENGYTFQVDVVNGQKTGFYLDQRENRKSIQKYVKKMNVLNCFAYTGGFSVYSLGAGAVHVTSIDSSQDAIDQAQKNVLLNNLPIENNTWITGDVFSELRLMRDKALSYDVIILDPPKFAPTAAQVRSASRGYKDINLLAFKLLNPGGILATFSCSGGVSRELFQKIVADAALDAEVDASILEILSQGKDHPIGLNFPEGAYLKGLVCKIK